MNSKETLGKKKKKNQAERYMVSEHYVYMFKPTNILQYIFTSWKTPNQNNFN